MCISCSKHSYLNIYINELFIECIHNKILSNASSPWIFLTNLVYNDPGLLDTYDVSYSGILLLLYQNYEHISIEYGVAFLNLLLIQTSFIYTKDMIKIYVEIYEVNKINMIFMTKLMFGIHMIDICRMQYVHAIDFIDENLMYSILPKIIILSC